ncbi:Phosphoribosylformylglycinamidine synthase subunit PurL [Pseudobythopirellula maris]|uniref:Phosphoribosylformylglycinamidine synthase subunit PurL n=1 Tax=Pseudobythopirellula maris TaxID=2527991 RepID=A0A5C5ZUK7_9BACT|nr:phosphoribosylformylglycinamidine synthase subunit PurL [Pseudobythopirellula maris]TWT90728.1 Phosphoribosylformylglycinamidine synthase subunit PurL [Pseudobythopirellula maris]
MTLWEVNLLPATGETDREARALERAAAELHDAYAAGEAPILAASARGFLIGAPSADDATIDRIVSELLADPVVERPLAGRMGDIDLAAPPAELVQRVGGSPIGLLHVLPKPGVMDPVAGSAEGAIADLGVAEPHVRSLRKYWVSGVTQDRLEELAMRLLANDAIEQVVVGPLAITSLDAGEDHAFELKHVDIAGLDDEGLMRLSREGQLYLQLAEMQTIQRYFADQGRAPTDIELETLAQTWSEHCSHKTLAGRIAYRDERGERRFENMLKETIFAATNKLREGWGADDWCVSVFKDNAGIVRFDETDNVCFKVETHNHPSALEPYGGANTGMGGVIRDTLGTGLGAKPICSTDVFCFAPPDTPDSELPPGVLPPRRVIEGVVAGVRDYGNRMGIPTVNGAVCFDQRYLGNPLVYCGNAGLIPHDKSFKEPQPNDLIVAIGGRTGRDGIHGATFSSAELTSESESLSGGAVQIGNAIEEKKVTDVLLQARDRGLFTAVTDCGAGGFSSAVGEMGEEIGAEVWLEKAPLKYRGLSYTEIWISEAQERMVFSVPDDKWEEMHALCEAEGVEASVLGRFTPTGDLKLTFHGETVGELPMALLHDGRPPVVREASYTPPATEPFSPPAKDDYTEDLLKILGSLNVASKEWVIRQYDHEVQGGSVIKPLVGVQNDGPGDAAVVRPKLSSRRGLVISCGINPRYGEFDTYRMAASAIDEAIRNAVAVGADPTRLALLDNFCWGDCERSETLGSLVRAALACHDLSLAFEAPFVSGKDSLNNEFSYLGAGGEKQTIAIPPTLLISAMGQVDDVAKCVTMDLKRAGNRLYAVGLTRDEMGGSHLALVQELAGGEAPAVDTDLAKTVFAGVHAAIDQGLVASCHDVSEGGLSAALAEMAFAGGLGVDADLSTAPSEGLTTAAVGLLFSESNSRFVCEVASENAEAFEAALGAAPHAAIGEVTATDHVAITADGAAVRADLAALKEAWQAPLRW